MLEADPNKGDFPRDKKYMANDTLELCDKFYQKHKHLEKIDNRLYLFKNYI